MVKDLLKNQRALIGVAVVVVLMFVLRSYNKQLGLSLSGMKGAEAKLAADGDFAARNVGGKPSLGQYPGETAPGGGPVQAANPMGMNSGPGNASGLQTITGGINANCMKQQVSDPKELLPKNSGDSNWAAANPRGSGELSNINLLKAGHHSGVNTVGGTLRNANLQVRSEPPNPKTAVSPWSNSTIEPDLMRVPLELGCGSQ